MIQLPGEHVLADSGASRWVFPNTFRQSLHPPIGYGVPLSTMSASGDLEAHVVVRLLTLCARLDRCDHRHFQLRGFSPNGCRIRNYCCTVVLDPEDAPLCARSGLASSVPSTPWTRERGR